MFSAFSWVLRQPGWVEGNWTYLAPPGWQSSVSGWVQCVEGHVLFCDISMDFVQNHVPTASPSAGAQGWCFGAGEEAVGPTGLTVGTKEPWWASFSTLNLQLDYCALTCGPVSDRDQCPCYTSPPRWVFVPPLSLLITFFKWTSNGEFQEKQEIILGWLKTLLYWI